MRALVRSLCLVVGIWIVIAAGFVWVNNRSSSPVSMLPSTVLLVGEYGQGSGFAIEPNLIATAGHCAEIDLKYVEAQDGTWHPIIESWRDDEYDVGFLRVAGSFPVINWGEVPDVLDKVYLLSCIHGYEYADSITLGYISYSVRDVYVWSGVLQVDVVGAPGSSGGVLLDEDLRIVGMCVGGDRSVPGVVFFEPVSHILEAYEDYKDATHEIEESCQEEVSAR